MAKLHNKVAAADLLAAVQSFLSTCRSPAVLEEADSPVPLLPGSYQLEVRAGRLCLEAPTEVKVLSRRITSVRQRRPGILDCTIQRFGGAEGKLTFLDLDRPQTANRQLAAARRGFGEQFRRMLCRQFPLWEISTLSSSMDLRRSFSPVFPRAALMRGSQVIAAIACPDATRESEFLTFALLWFEHIRTTHTSLCLFLPQGSGSLTAHRLRWLRNEVLQPTLFLYNEHGSAGEVDPQDLGNLDTRVGSQLVQPHLTTELRALLHCLSDLPYVSVVPELDGALSLRLRGLQFARIEAGQLHLGLESLQPVSGPNFARVVEFARQLLELRSSDKPQLPAAPERWLEGAVRASLQKIDVNLQASPVHGQVLTFAGKSRESVDLLAVSFMGRLTILELKATEDLHLPMQALDYWMRVRWHSERNEIAHLFPGTPLTSQPPRLLLIAPALSFHSSNVTVLSYFSSQVEVERIGVNSDWQTQFRVVLRLTGADTPISHGRS